MLHLVNCLRALNRLVFQYSISYCLLVQDQTYTIKRLLTYLIFIPKCLIVIFSILLRKLAINLIKNFNQPYFSANIAEFWRRWHIALSQWLRDYVYIWWLGGNRRGNLFTLRNLALTMMLGGLWHGAAWTFLLWGTLHGAFLIAHRLSTSGGRGSADEERIALRDLPAIVLCFHAVCIGWVFFRAPDVATAMTVLGTIATGSYASPWPWLQVVVVSACAALHVAERIGRVHVAELQAACGSTRWGPAVEGLALGAALALAVAVSDSGGDFIYFQF